MEHGLLGEADEQPKGVESQLCIKASPGIGATLKPVCHGDAPCAQHMVMLLDTSWHLLHAAGAISLIVHERLGTCCKWQVWHTSLINLDEAFQKRMSGIWLALVFDLMQTCTCTVTVVRLMSTRWGLT